MTDQKVKNIIEDLQWRADSIERKDKPTEKDEGIIIGYRTAANLLSGHLNEVTQ